MRTVDSEKGNGWELGWNTWDGSMGGSLDGNWVSLTITIKQHCLLSATPLPSTSQVRCVRGGIERAGVDYWNEKTFAKPARTP
jgi:hypothetical protein